MVSRCFYISFYILYLIFLAIALWFFPYYSGVPGWVWIFFAVGILLSIIGVLMKEFLLKRKEVVVDSYTFWLVFYILLHIGVFILIIMGIIFVIQYSNIPWWVWIIIGIAILLSIFSNVFFALNPKGIVWNLIFSISALILYVIGVILLILYSNSPWWVWSILAISIVLYILAVIFEPISERNQIIIKKEEHIRTIEKSKPINLSLLPSTSIPEQVIK